MTPEQKEAHRREVLEEAADVTDTLAYDAFDAHDPRAHALLEIASARIRALAPSQPAPKYREHPTHHVHRGLDSLPCHCWADGDHRIGEEVDAPAADTGQAVADAKFAIRVAFRKAIRDLPEIAPKEVQAVLASVLMHDAFLAEGKRLQQLHGLDAVAPRVEQECAAGAWSFMRQGILAATQPAAHTGQAVAWRDMASAPKDATEIILRIPSQGWPDHYAQIGHWAEETSGEEQPRLRGWFRKTGYGFAQLDEPTGWKPLAHPAPLDAERVREDEQ